MERKAITQEETRRASGERELFNIALRLITSVDVISRRLLISVPSP